MLGQQPIHTARAQLLTQQQRRIIKPCLPIRQPDSHTKIISARSAQQVEAHRRPPENQHRPRWLVSNGVIWAVCVLRGPRESRGAGLA
jgi:hypothetical protein